MNATDELVYELVSTARLAQSRRGINIQDLSAALAKANLVVWKLAVKAEVDRHRHDRSRSR